MALQSGSKGELFACMYARMYVNIHVYMCMNEQNLCARRGSATYGVFVRMYIYIYIYIYIHTYIHANEYTQMRARVASQSG